MKFYCYEDSEVLLDKVNFIQTINIKGNKEGLLLESLNESDVKDVLLMLNKINNQGISDINFSNYSYVVDGKRLRFESLSTSELLFLLAYASNKRKIFTFFCDDILQLTHKTFNLFYKIFGKSPYVNFVYRDSYLKEYFEELVGGAKICMD